MRDCIITAQDKSVVQFLNGRSQLTANFQVNGLVVLADGVGGAAEVLAGVGELDVLQGERGNPSMAAHHDVPIDALKERRKKTINTHLCLSLKVWCFAEFWLV